jgi:YidC/Oxa1 family membrane protein insertase
METRRLVLYALLGIVCFALWNAWQKDFPGKTVPTEVVASSSIKDAEQAEKSFTTLKTTATKVVSKQLIKVHTDVLDLAIDPTQGNIVQADLIKYKKEMNDPTPVRLLDYDPGKIYLASSGLVSKKGEKSFDTPSYFRTTQNEYTLKEGEKELAVNLFWKNAEGLSVTKTYIFTPGSYDIKVNYEINNQSGKTWAGTYFATLERQNVKPEKKGFFQVSTFQGVAISSEEKPYEKISYEKMAEKNLDRYIHGGWLSIQQKYFITAWVPSAKEAYHYYTTKAGEDLYSVGLNYTQLEVFPGKKQTINSDLYLGPEIAKNLRAVAPHLDLAVDYGWLWFISIVLFWIMQQIYSLVGNWGWSIILVTILIKAAFYKLSSSSYASMNKMRELAPRLQTLKERYGDDRQKLSQATMELYRREKINPLALGGCLPQLIQIPVFIALYYVLAEAVELRHAPFIFWIHDLSAKDPYYVLPILMGVSMFITQKMSPQAADPTQAKMFMLLPVVFTVLFISFPSGLVLYWLVNNCLSALQQWQVMRSAAKAKK